MLQRHITEYLEDFPFTSAGQIRQQLCGVEITLDVMLFESGYQRRQKARLRLAAGERRYECLCVDTHDWENMLYPVALNGRQLLCFRKSLYGFTLLDAETLEEVFEYFPAAVLDGKESFIITNAQARFGLLFFEGCYWADVYGTFVFDPARQRFAHLSKAAGLGNIHSELHFDGEYLVLKSDPIYKIPRQVRLTEQQIREILARDGEAGM